MYENQQPKEKAVLACVNTGAFDVQASLDELAELADTAGAEVLGQFIQNRDAPIMPLIWEKENCGKSGTSVRNRKRIF